MKPSQRLILTFALAWLQILATRSIAGSGADVRLLGAGSSWIKAGESFQLELRIDIGDPDLRFNGFEASVSLGAPGLLYEKVEWRKPFEAGADDLSLPDSNSLPQVLGRESLELTNVVPDGSLASGGLVATLRFRVPLSYSGPSNVRIRFQPTAILRGFESLPIDEPAYLSLRLGPLPPSASQLILQHNSGLIGYWEVNGAQLVSRSLFEPESLGDPRWQIVSAGDYDRDGSQDLILAFDGSTLGYWRMSGSKRIGSGLLTPESEVPGGWRIVGSADLDGDLAKDLVFRHRDGQLGVWFMVGFQRREARILDLAIPEGWEVVGFADFDGDGIADLALQHPLGYIGVWFLFAGGELKSQSLLSEGAPLQLDGWRIVALRDLNRDGAIDLVFGHTDGSLGGWSLSGTTALEIQSTFLLNTPALPAGWRVVAP